MQSKYVPRHVNNTAKIGHLNTRSLYPKIDEIRWIVDKNNFDIFVSVKLDYMNDKTSSVLDVTLTSHPALHRKRAVLKYTLSDHCLIYTDMEFENTKPSAVDHNTEISWHEKFRHGEFLQWSSFIWHY